MSKPPELIDTGTGVMRRRLTEEEAKRGGLPAPWTDEEKVAAHQAAAILDYEMTERRATMGRLLLNFLARHG